MSTAMEYSVLPRHKITVDEYYRMGELGLLAPDARVELIEGEIIDMPSIGDRHGGTVSQLDHLLQRVAGERAQVRCQNPVHLSHISEPVPDLALVIPRADYYKRRHPTAGDTLLIVEVSVSTLHFDRGVKVPLYARHGVPEVWILDLPHGRLHRCGDPAEGGYATIETIEAPGLIAPAALPGAPVDLGAVLAPE